MKEKLRMKSILLLPVLLLLGGCFGSQKRGVEVSYHDLGVTAYQPAENRSGSTIEGVRKVEVRSASWLASADMQYRFTYSDATRRRSYADSRWVATPAEMLEFAMTRALVGNSASATYGCRLQIELDEFIQVFDAPQISYVVVETRLSLFGPRADRALAQRKLHLTRAAASAEAVGGVVALSAAAGELVTESSKWLDFLKRETPGIVAQCNS